jgi:hypothetical protein
MATISGPVSLSAGATRNEYAGLELRRQYVEMPGERWVRKPPAVSGRVFQVIDRLKDEVVTGMNPEEAIGG